ncbi:MAG: EamA family transporter [Muribaculaceae bacterium]|nr:EamA family transporter [Muribaculaceae bacterium]
MGKFKGYLLAALAAAAYGTNPAFAIPLYEMGMNPNSVLLFRYGLGIPILAILMAIRKIDYRIHSDEIIPVFILGVLMAVSSLTLFESYNYMNSGVASTLLFVYPIMVAVIMTFFFKEHFKASLILCFIFMIGGLILLMRPDGNAGLSGFGFLLVMVSALTYAIYIVLVNASKAISRIPTTKLLFYVLIFGCSVFIFKIMVGTELTFPDRGIGWYNLVALAVIPTVLSLACTSAAIHIIGSTPTAIFGALEPVTAVILSIAFLGQSITPNEIVGGLLIVVATTIVVTSNSVDKFILHVRKFFPRHLIHKK